MCQHRSIARVERAHREGEAIVTGPAMIPAGGVRVPPQLLRRQRSALTWVTTIVLGLGAVLIGILLLLTGGPAAAVLTTAVAALSFPLLILVCFWLDRYEPEPGRYRLAALGWGGVAAVALSFIAEQLLFAIPGTDTFVDTAIIAPIVEEFGKALFLIAIVIFRRAQIHGLLDGIVYGALVGIGFAFVEDILYYLGALNEGALPTVVFLRGILGPFAHPLFTSATGIGIGVAVTTRRPALRILAPILGYLAAATMHGIWNGSSFWGGRGFFFAYAAIMLPLLIVVLAVAIWARYREGRMLTAALRQTAQMGWIRPEEIRWVAQLSDRISARAYARRIGGRPAAQALRAYQQTLIEIAFLHNRAVTGTAPPDLNQRMAELLQRAAYLRPYVILPPPLLPRPLPR
jgi:RsiW-degrading membrane proteinase PrsW (M82 family)